MAGGASNNDGGAISDINVTPLVDIMLVLVIILMVTGEFTNKVKTIPLDLPQVKTGVTTQGRKQVAVTITPENKIYFQDREMSLSGLQANLKSRKKITPELKVILRSEGATKYSDIMSLLNEIKAAGISDVSLAVASERKKENAQPGGKPNG